MPLYIADYRADTGHLTAAEHGAYLLLIMHYWQKGGLPIEDGALGRIACMTSSEWKRARPTIKAFFTEDWRHGRIDEELATANAKYENRVAAGRAGGMASAKAKQASSNRSTVAATDVAMDAAPLLPANDKQASTNHNHKEQPQCSVGLPQSSSTESIPLSGGASRQRKNGSNYAFSGAIIHLTQDDFDRWKSSYPNIPDLRAALTKADDYYREHQPADGKWFFPVSRWLEKENTEAMNREKQAQRDRCDRW